MTEEQKQLSNTQKQQAEEKFKQGADHVTEEQLDEAVKSGQEKINKLESAIPKALLEQWENIKILFSLIKDYAKGDYKDIPWTSIAAVVSAILYFVSPIDIIPDFIPVIGYLDDAAVIAICMSWIKVDVEKYKIWKEKENI